MKWGVVEGSQSKWPLQFAAMFEVEKVSTRPTLNTNHVVLAVSCRGVFLIEEPYKLLCGLHYYEIIEVSLERWVFEDGFGRGFVFIHENKMDRFSMYHIRYISFQTPVLSSLQ